MYYTIQNGVLLLSTNISALSDFYDNVKPLPADYEAGKYIVEDNQLVLNPNYEAEKAQQEKERIAQLYLTGADVERGIYQAKGMDFDDILEFVKANQPEGLDIKALKIELKANNFYRGNPYVDAIGGLLGFTKEQLDLFFETNDYTYLIQEPVVDNSDATVKENLTVEDVTEPEDEPNPENENADVEDVLGDDVTHNDPIEEV